MGKTATSSKIQIQTLRDRGMELDLPEEKIKEILLDIGYYRLGFYWNPFEKNKSHEFNGGTKFSDVVKLYYLDVDLRNILSRYINRIEINFRTKVVYYVSNKYKTSSTWFIDPIVMNSRFISTINDYYNDKFKNNNRTIQLHHKKYPKDTYAPAWKTLEFFTFGSITKIFKSLNDQDIRKRIANEYNVLNLNKFVNLIDTIVFVRNTCAHGGVLFDFQIPEGIAILPGINFNSNNRHSLDSCIKIISYILNSVSESRRIEMDELIKDLFKNHKDNNVIRGIIESKIGYKFD
ncbi:Abi family protein [Flavobacterium sp. DG1-102-2]|uniref:Abi family protein n=1 Tax=Flavobacterium sp. DG1-102-2 TaxID=3081663 RepID=UPI002949F595|nr:Abi family protein [Flavobacterium sp. DG1-102-2]MDV6169586.1 Abi family protein [Flavobacterium sp. DG1-102-2]